MYGDPTAGGTVNNTYTAKDNKDRLVWDGRGWRSRSQDENHNQREKVMRGDLTVYGEARAVRDQRMRDRSLRREKRAQVEQSTILPY